MSKTRDPFRGVPVKLVDLARALGITHGAISQWDAVPPGRVLAVERHTGISRYVLRPDIYGDAPEQAKGAA